MYGISALAQTEGYTTFQAYPKSPACIPSKKNDIQLCTFLINRINQKLAYLTGFNGQFAYFTTETFLKELNNIKPDLLHFHNLHNSYINLPLLFNYVKENNIPVIWTLHDCWSFTGQCAHFTYAKCDKWKKGCGDCPQLEAYPASRIDLTAFMWKQKRRWFTGIDNLTIITPSYWLADLVKQSFLKEYPIKVIHNGIDLNVFKPQENSVSVKEEFGIKENAYMILGVAYGWGMRKGLDVFIELAKRLGPQYQIVLVGTDERTEQILPKNIISIRRTNNQQQLAELYSAADVFVNPTREDNFPTTNIEAIACGTPVITFNTGGSAEMLDKTCGSVVEPEDIEGLVQEIKRVCVDKPFSQEACLNRAKEFDMNKKFEEYVSLYNQIIKSEQQV